MSLYKVLDAPLNNGHHTSLARYLHNNNYNLASCSSHLHLAAVRRRRGAMEDKLIAKAAL
jgi:cytochrome b